MLLDILIKISIDYQTETCVHRKETNANLYINWNAHAPLESKILPPKKFNETRKYFYSTKT